MDSEGSVNWTRGWVAPDGVLPLAGDAWLPEADWLQYGGTGVITLEDVRELRGLLLLGEPGSGKSACLKQERATVEATKAVGDTTLLVDLGLVSDARDLREQVFGDPVFHAWRTGDGRLHLFLDALDEAKVQIHRVVGVITRDSKSTT
jgi:hypothetical protein